MPILDLSNAKPIEGLKPQRSLAKRTMTPQNTPAILSGGMGGGTFAGARVNRLTDFTSRTRSADADLFGDNIRLRARARDLFANNPFGRKFGAMVVQNVVGPAGILLQAKVRGVNGKNTAETKRINQRIEEEFRRWSRPGKCTADGKFSFPGLQGLAIKNVAREGENLLKKVYGRQFNSTAFALQTLDNDQLDDTLMTSVGDNVTIRMGVEVDQYLRPLAYHLWSGHPMDMLPSRSRTRVRVPASEIIHTAVWERPAQTRGYTWMSAAILSMNMHAGWNEATLVAARASAAKFAVIEKTAAEGYNPDEEDGEGNDTNSDGTQFMSGNAGEIEQLDVGEHLNFIDPRFPMNSHAEFNQAVLRSIATGLLVSFPSLANDLEGVNFSSIRAGMLDERDCWRILQRWFIDWFCWPIFNAWLDMALLTTLSDITLTADQREQMEWKARGWEWVDPLKDAQAIVLKLQNGLTTYADALAQLGMDFEETMTERAAEQAFLEALGIVLGTDIRGQADTATDDSMNQQDGQQQDSAKGGKQATTKEAAAKPAAGAKQKSLDADRIEQALELFRTLRSYR